MIRLLGFKKATAPAHDDTASETAAASSSSSIDSIQARIDRPDVTIPKNLDLQNDRMQWTKLINTSNECKIDDCWMPPTGFDKELKEQMMSDGIPPRSPVFVFGAAIPDDINTYAKFLKQFGESKGTIVEFGRKKANDPWMIVTKGGTFFVKKGGQKGERLQCTIRKWDEEHLKPLLLYRKSHDDYPNSMVYLVDIEIKDQALADKLYESSDIFRCTNPSTGVHTLDSYINTAFGIDASKEAARYYLSPPSDGCILTSWHRGKI